MAVPEPPPPPPPHATRVIKNSDANKFLTAIAAPDLVWAIVMPGITLMTLFMDINYLQILEPVSVTDEAN